MLGPDQRYLETSNLERASRVLESCRGLESFTPIDTSSKLAGLSIVVLTKDKPQFVVPLIDQLGQAVLFFKDRGALLEVIIGDTGSSDPQVLSAYASLPEGVRVERGLSYHFSKNNNALAMRVRSEHVLFMNNDMRFADAGMALWQLYTQLQESDAFDVLGAQLCFEGGLCQHSGVYFSRHASQWALPYHLGAGDALNRLPLPLEVPALTGAFLAMRTQSFLELAGFEPFYRAECQDIDLCLKARRVGGRCRVLDLGKIVHFENGTRELGEKSLADRSDFLRRWQLLIEEEFLVPRQTR
jgi:GT2 family glycosyltransferase